MTLYVTQDYQLFCDRLRPIIQSPKFLGVLTVVANLRVRPLRHHPTIFRVEILQGFHVVGSKMLLKSGILLGNDVV